MDAKPDWVPEWAWEEYEAFNLLGLTMLSSEILKPGVEKYSDDELRTVSRKLMFDSGCSSVWKAINKRREASKETSFDGDCFQLLAIATHCFRGVPQFSAMPASERRTRADRIAMLSEALRDEILSLRDNGGVPMTIRQGIFASWREAYLQRGAKMGDDYPLDAVEEKVGQITAIMFLGKVSDRIYYSDTPNFFSVLAAAAREWGSTRPHIYRPNSPGARRTYFVQCVTRHFRERYKTPLRAQVAALVRCVYDEDIDVSTIAKLAP